MTIFERYLLRTFAKIFLICLASFTGLFLVVHLFTNYDELQALAKTYEHGSEFFLEFYGPRVLDLFDRMVGILILAASAFSFAMMQRRREITAIEAAGISKARMTRTLIWTGALVIALSTLNREYLMPQYREQLTSTAQNWKAGSSAIRHFQKDHLNGTLIRSERVDFHEGTMNGIVVQIPMHLSPDIPKIVAMSATYLSANDQHPDGLLMDRVTEPRMLARKTELKNESGTVVYFPGKSKWLKPNQCFVATNLTLDELAHGQDLNDYASLPEMIESLKRPTQWYSRSNRILVHTRVARPVMDFTLFLFALPLVIRFSENNLFAAVASCIASIAAFQISFMTCQVLGSFSLIPTASLTAWLPIIIYLPATIWTWHFIDC